MKSAWAYCAVSSSPQESTLEQQETWAREVAAANGWTLERVFTGVGSGAKGPRELLGTLLAEVRNTPRAQRPERVLMVRLDRVGRQALDCIGSVAELRRLGVTLHTQAEGDLQLETAMDSLRPIFALITAEMENDVRSQKWKAALARRRSAGLHHGIVPFGVVLLDGKAVPYEPEAAIVREIFEKAAAGWGYGRLARWVRGIAPTKRLADGSERALRWSPSTIKGILRGATIRQLLIEPELIDRMEAARGSSFRARGTKRWAWPLSGAIRCTCGKILTGHACGSGKYRFRYYTCRFHSLEPGQRSHPSHRAEALETAFESILGRLSANPDLFIDRGKKHNAEALRTRKMVVQKRLETLEHRRRRACELAEDGSLSGPQLRERLDEIDADRTAAREELERIRIDGADLTRYEEQSVSVRSILKTISQRWTTAPIELRQEIARAVAVMLDGLSAAPEQRGRLIIGAKLRKTDVSRILATGERMFHGKHF